MVSNWLYGARTEREAAALWRAGEYAEAAQVLSKAGYSPVMRSGFFRNVEAEDRSQQRAAARQERTEAEDQQRETEPDSPASPPPGRPRRRRSPRTTIAAMAAAVVYACAGGYHALPHLSGGAAIAAVLAFLVVACVFRRSRPRTPAW